MTNIADPEAEKKLSDLYAEGADWNQIIRRLSEERIGAMAKFKGKMVEIDAVRVMVADYNGQTWDGPPFSEMPGWLSAAIETGMVVPVTPGSTDYAEWEIRTLEGTMLAGPGDWIICDTEGKLYPCKPFVFERQYEPLP